MNLCFVDSKSEGDVEEQIQAISKEFRLTDIVNADVIYCGTIRTSEKSWLLKKEHSLPLVTYCWDYYKWAHEGRHPGEGDWKGYARFLKQADLILVPSHAQQLRLKELLGLDSEVVRSGVKKYNSVTHDEGFILDPVREYPDENCGWAETAAYELEIPFLHTEHRYTHEQFRELVATCTFMTCAYREASTGGLTLAEGLWLGKPSLVSNSPYMGARDYLGEYGYYFQYDSFKALKEQMQFLWETRPQVDPISYDKNELSFERMAKEIRLCVQKLNF